MEALLLFQIYWVCDLKASQITMRWNNDVLGLFFSLAHSGFDWILSEATVFSPRKLYQSLGACSLLLKHRPFLVKVMGCSHRR